MTSQETWQTLQDNQSRIAQLERQLTEANTQLATVRGALVTALADNFSAERERDAANTALKLLRLETASIYWDGYDRGKSTAIAAAEAP